MTDTPFRPERHERPERLEAQPVPQMRERRPVSRDIQPKKRQWFKKLDADAIQGSDSPTDWVLAAGLYIVSTLGSITPMNGGIEQTFHGTINPLHWTINIVPALIGILWQVVLQWRQFANAHNRWGFKYQTALWASAIPTLYGFWPFLFPLFQHAIQSLINIDQYVAAICVATLGVTAFFLQHFPRWIGVIILGCAAMLVISPDVATPIAWVTVILTVLLVDIFQEKLIIQG